MPGGKLGWPRAVVCLGQLDFMGLHALPPGFYGCQSLTFYWTIEGDIFCKFGGPLPKYQMLVWCQVMMMMIKCWWWLKMMMKKTKKNKKKKKNMLMMMTDDDDGD